MPGRSEVRVLATHLLLVRQLVRGDGRAAAHQDRAPGSEQRLGELHLRLAAVCKLRFLRFRREQLRSRRIGSASAGHASQSLNQQPSKLDPDSAILDLDLDPYISYTRGRLVAQDTVFSRSRPACSR